MIRIYALCLLAQVVDTPGACEAATDAVESIKEAVKPHEEHSCGCDHHKRTGEFWNVYACNADGKRVGVVGAKYICCATTSCGKRCN